MRDIKQILLNHSKKLQNLAAEIEATQLKSPLKLDLSYEVWSDQANAEEYLQNLSLLNGSGVYLIKTNLTIDETIISCYKGFKERCKADKSIEVKTAKFNQGGSQYFYVGSSKDLTNRLRQHLGYGNRKTYALALKQWLTVNVPLIIEVYNLPQCNQDLLEAVEQAFWDEYKPVFGKRSGH